MSVTIKKVPKPKRKGKIVIGPKALTFSGTGVAYIGQKGSGKPLIPLGKVSNLKVMVSPDKNHSPELCTLRVMGVDISTHTGVVVLGFDKSQQVWRTLYDEEIQLGSLPNTATVGQRMGRCWDFQNKLGVILENFSPEIVAVEGYAYGKVQSQTTMVELGAAARMAFLYGKHPALELCLEVAPSTLKKYAIGKGVGSKDQVMMHTFKRWGYEAATNNMADAYVLAQIAAGFLGIGQEGLTKPQLEVLKGIKQKIA